MHEIFKDLHRLQKVRQFDLINYKHDNNEINVDL